MFHLESLYHARKSIEFFHFCRNKLDNPIALLKQIAETQYAPMFGITDASGQIQFVEKMCEECSEETTDEEFITWAMQAHPRAKKKVQWFDKGKVRAGLTIDQVNAEMDKRKLDSPESIEKQDQLLGAYHALYMLIKKGTFTTRVQIIEYVEKSIPYSDLRTMMLDDPGFAERMILAIEQGIGMEPPKDTSELEQFFEALQEVMEISRRQEAIKAVADTRAAIAKQQQVNDDLQLDIQKVSQVIQFHEKRKDLLKQDGTSG